MVEETWQQARLIPTSGIHGQEEAERRATSALLAVMSSVREFGLAMVRPLGAPAGRLEAFIEVPFELGGRTIRPDGLIRTVRGAKTWNALVEVKTGNAELRKEQIDAYVDIARENDFDVVLTISNQIAPAPGVHVLDLDGRKLKKVKVVHMSWAEVLTIAVQQRVHHGVSDPDQAWILSELIRYLEHPRSGALDFSDMGAAWVTVREALAAGTLRASDKGVPDVVSRWEQLLRFAALRLGRELGAHVEVLVSRKEAADPASRFATQTDSLVRDGVLSGSLRIPDAVAPLDVVADLRGKRLTVSVTVDAPRDGKPTTRVNWLVRQLRDAPDTLRIDAFVAGSRTSTSELLRVARDKAAVLVTDPAREFRAFRVAATSPMGTKRGTGRGAFIDGVLTAVDGFYESVVQQLRPWAAKAPRLPEGGRSATEEAGIDVTPPATEVHERSAPEVSGPVPPDTPAPDAVVDGVARVADASPYEPDDSQRAEVQPARPADNEMVSWDDAHARLDHEREARWDAATEAPAG
jgi:hypothetical protein